MNIPFVDLKKQYGAKKDKYMTNISKLKKCPCCEANWDGGDILEYFRKLKKDGDMFYGDESDEEIISIAENYGYYIEDCMRPDWEGKMESKKKNHARFQKGVTGMEIMGAYDGILYWVCDSCKTYWHRFTGKQYTEKEFKKIKNHSRWER